ncbi:MAG: hypothetical protein QW404_00415 [Candidatus Nanoarchaeia archaeon]
MASASDNVVSGTIYKLRDSSTVSDASVTVVCNNIVKKTTSDYDGSYVVFYDPAECSEGDKVKVTAKKGRFYGSTVETMTDFGLIIDIDIAVADVFVKRVGNGNPKLQLSGFVDDYSRDVFVRLNNYGAKSDTTLVVTNMETGEQFTETMKLKKNDKVLRVFQFVTMDLVPGENVIELFAKAGDIRSTKYISYYN